MSLESLATRDPVGPLLARYRDARKRNALQRNVIVTYRAMENIVRSAKE